MWFYKYAEDSMDRKLTNASTLMEVNRKVTTMYKIRTQLKDFGCLCPSTKFKFSRISQNSRVEACFYKNALKKSY